MKFMIFFPFISVVLLMGCTIDHNSNIQQEQKEICGTITTSYGVSHVCNRGDCVVVELARTSQEHLQGLMGREKLQKDAGMLFVFKKPGIYSFWMKNTLIPLDMVRIDTDYTIVDIQTAQPCLSDPCGNYDPAGISQYVLEINAGYAKELGWKVGDRVDIQLSP